MEWARVTVLSTVALVRAHIEFVVACVGRHIRVPYLSVAVASLWAAIHAVSVFPDPVGVAIVNRPGPVGWKSSMIDCWSGFGDRLGPPRIRARSSGPGVGWAGPSWWTRARVAFRVCSQRAAIPMG